MNTDANTFAVSAILMQKCGDNLLPVSYFSKTLNKTEQRYENLKWELMAIVKDVLTFKHYLWGRRFFIISDCKVLEHFDHVVSPADIITRKLMTLSKYNFEFKHIPVKSNAVADYFSRTPFPNTANLQTNPELLSSDQILPVDVVEKINAFAVLNANNNCFSHPPNNLSANEAQQFISD